MNRIYNKRTKSLCRIQGKTEFKILKYYIKKLESEQFRTSVKERTDQ